ncbi:MAG: agmatine deiminase family protein [Prevotella sp.]|nr:agmatine deiminase family protein [Prevotella sp.]
MDETNYILPAEWYPQSAIQLTWPHEGTDWKPYLEEITNTYIQLAKVITSRERLVVATQDPDIVKQQLMRALSKKAFRRVSFCQCPIDDTWARDHGTLTLLPFTHSYRKCSEAGAQAISLKFRFNGWGGKFPAENDNNIAFHLYEEGHLTNQLEDHSDFELEGGAIESDGRGTIMTTTQCQMLRNQPRTQQEIEDELKRRLHANRVIWIDHGHLIGDDTDGHIDTIVRMAPHGAMLYTYCDDPNDEHFADFQALEQQMKTLRRADGYPYRLHRLPLPDAIYETDGHRLPATYANFLVANRGVIVPTYNQPAKDDEALRVISAAFPNYKIIPIDARTIIRQHGSIHCLTMHFPRGTAK